MLDEPPPRVYQQSRQTQTSSPTDYTMSCSPSLFAPQPILQQQLLSRPIFSPPYPTQPIETQPIRTLSYTFNLSSTPSPSSSSSSHSPKPQPQTPTYTLSKPLHTRPKTATKKPCASTPHKQKSVQMSLEVKVERAKGFHAFFVPLARSMPPAPPSSPVLRAQSGCGSGGCRDGDRDGDGEGHDLIERKLDLNVSGRWGERSKRRSEEEWVEDVEESMEVNSE